MRNMWLTIALVIYSYYSLLGGHILLVMLWREHWIERIYLSLIEVCFQVISPTRDPLVENFRWHSISS